MNLKFEVVFPPNKNVKNGKNYKNNDKKCLKESIDTEKSTHKMLLFQESFPNTVHPIGWKLKSDPIWVDWEEIDNYGL